MDVSLRRAPRSRIFVAIVAALSFPTTPGLARTLGPGQQATVGASDAAERWSLSSAQLTIDGGTALSVLGVQSRFFMIGGSVVHSDTSSSSSAVELRNESQATISGASITSQTGDGLAATVQGVNPTLPNRVTVDDSTITGATMGVRVGGGSQLTITGSQLVGGTAGLAVLYGQANLANASVRGRDNGMLIFTDQRGGSVGQGIQVSLDATDVESAVGSAILIRNRRGAATDDVTVDVSNGSTLKGANGIALEVAPTAMVAGMPVAVMADVAFRSSAIDGDVSVADGAALTLGLREGATLNGAVNGNAALAVDGTSAWTIARDSELAALSLSGRAAFSPTGDGTHRVLHVTRDFGGSGGLLGFQTLLNEGGALGAQHTDRLLVEGNVTTTGPTEVVVTPSGPGGLTDADRDGVVGANEGISLIQVAGDSRADAFALRGGYVARGAYQYTLHAFGPDEVDQAQNALAGGPLRWDYRLGNRYVCQEECEPVDPPVDPGGPGPGDGGGEGEPENPGNPGDPGDPGNPGDPEPPPVERVAVVPQLPSYLSAPAALLTYGDMMNDGLHQRLGDIRHGSSHDPVGGEVFARYLGGQLRYSSNLSFKRYGYDFDQQVNALQLGGSLIALDGDNGSLRAGWAADQGTTRVTPKAADGNSTAKYHANGIAAWITWQHGDGFWMDGVLGATRYRGDVGTDMRGDDVGRIRAHGWTASIEAGVPIALGGDWTVEPRFQLKHQQINFRNFVDGDGLDVRLGTARQTSATLGGRITRTAQPLFMPYASVDLTHSSNGDPTTDVSSDAFNVRDSFATGRKGNAYRVAAGAISQVGEHVQLFGEGTYQHFVGGYGMRGWAGNLGIRVTF